MPWQQWKWRTRVPAKSAPLQRGPFLQGGVALLSLRPGHWKGRCCAEGDPRKDRQVQKELVKGGGKSGGRWPIWNQRYLQYQAWIIYYMKPLFYLIRGLGPRRKVMPVATKLVRGWHSSWVNIKFAVIHDWFEGHDVRQPVSTRNDHSFNVHWAWYGWKGHWLLALWAHENPPGIHVQITPKGNNVVHNERALSKQMTPSALVIIMASDSRNFIICSAFLKRLMPFRETPRSADT